MPEVRTFLSFISEVYDTEQLSFYLYARAVVVSQNDEFCIKNEEICIKNEESCIKNDEFCSMTEHVANCNIHANFSPIFSIENAEMMENCP